MKQVDKDFAKKKDLEKKRGNYPILWDACGKYIIPDRAKFLTSTTPGTENNTIFITEAIRSNTILGHGLHTNLTSPSDKWFRISLKDKKKAENWNVKMWLDIVNNIMYSSFADSSFYHEIVEFWMCLGAFGTSPLFMSYEPYPFKLLFKEFSCRDALISENRYGEIDTIVRPKKMTVSQMVDEFGEDNLSRETKQLLKDHKYDEDVKTFHLCEPNKNRNKKSDLYDGMEFRSVYYETDTKHLLEEKGYEKFPYLIGKFYNWGESVYGRGPGALALPDIRTGNQQKKTNLRAGNYMAEPAHNVPHDYKGRMRLVPRAQIPMSKNGQKTEPINIGANGLPYNEKSHEMILNDIRSFFFVDYFLMMDQGNNVYKNIPEIAMREQEKILMLGPVVNRNLNLVIKPIVENAFYYHMEARAVPPPPPQLMPFDEIEVEFTSPFAITQKQSGMMDISRSIELSAPAIQLNPNAAKVLKTDKIVRKFLELANVPAELINSEEEVKLLIQAEQQVMADQQQKDEILSAIGGLKTLADADKSSGGKISEQLEV